MTDSPTRSPSVQRAITAERQVERLERELEKSAQDPTASPNSPRATVFQLKEQVHDLKLQLRKGNDDYATLQTSSSQKMAEYESKLKKMRDIFSQATKNIDKYRATIQSQGQTISRVNEELASAQQQMIDLNNTAISQKHTKLKTSRATYLGEKEQWEADQRHLQQQVDQLKVDYDQYKKRAHQLLEQRQPQTSDQQVSDLQSQIKRLTMENMLQDLQAKLISMDIVKQQLDDKQKRIEQLEQQTHQDRDHHEKALKTLQAAHDRLLREMTSDDAPMMPATPSPNTQSPVLANRRGVSPDLHTTIPASLSASSSDPSPVPAPNQRELTPQEKEQKEALENIMEYLNDDNARLRQHVDQLQREIASLQQTATPTDAPPTSANHPALADSSATIADKSSYQPPLDVYSSMVHLLTPLVSKPPEDRSVHLEKQVLKLKDLLQDSEEQLAVLRQQEQVLKAEIRKLDGVDKRHNMSNEYLKNVMLKFLTAENKQALLPVLAKVLFLDAQETKQLQKAFV
ncbi:hypothetical protein DM01DRAFT_316247 [Hesseltinella vesiculosa]|uniref:GRIP domain-containing protein n=1 Tax=Hesseltinella vesiculosa TaxID=101127 RepID=A0A1X2GXN8_9FUNG|nr:hypothetical protein DM01DRAFT_316247 [Hesseltinella vesiculosa]